jgi:hypothetical protein
MIGLDRIVSVLLDHMACGGQYLIKHPWVGGRPISGYLSRSRAMLESTSEKAAGGRQIPLLGYQDVDDLTVLVDRPIQTDPPPGNLDVVRLTRSALPVFLLVGFSGPPPEPDVPVSRASGSPQVPLGGMFPSRTDRPRAGDLCSPV